MTFLDKSFLFDNFTKSKGNLSHLNNLIYLQCISSTVFKLELYNNQNLVFLLVNGRLLTVSGISICRFFFFCQKKLVDISDTALIMSS